MSKFTDVMNNQVLRGMVLEICQQAYPKGASTELIRAALKQQGHVLDGNEATSLCSYLEGKGLVRIVNAKNEVLKINRDIAHITPKGIDVLEGTETADGIALMGD